MDNFKEDTLHENPKNIRCRRTHAENESIGIYPSTSNTPPTQSNQEVSIKMQNLDKKLRQNRRKIRAKNFAQPIEVKSKKSNTDIERQYCDIDNISRKLDNLSYQSTSTQENKIINNAKIFKKKQKKKQRSLSTGDTVDYMHYQKRYYSNSLERNLVYFDSTLGSQCTEDAQSQTFKENRKMKSPVKKHVHLKHNSENCKLELLNDNIKIKDVKKKKKRRSGKGTFYDEYLTATEMEKGLRNGTLFYGSIRINPKDYKTAYISNPNKNEQDVMIISVRDRNRALDGDIVVVQLKDRDEKQPLFSDTGIVVGIKEEVHPRVAVGTLKAQTDNKQGYRLFRPRDSRLPRMQIPLTDLILKTAENDEEILYLARISEWHDIQFAVGELLECIGPLGDLIAESRAILLENGLNADRHSLEEMKTAAELCAKPLSQDQIAARLDLRSKCIFTVDPLTARDLDDAMSCVELEDGTLLVGVHIADVSYYVKDGSPLDKVVQDRATSIYTVDAVLHMLPAELCMQCSLLPGQDRFAFSVIWHIDPVEAHILEHNFARTIVRTCVQLAYEHAQSIIDQPDADPVAIGLPTVHDGHTVTDVVRAIRLLHALAKKLRTARYDRGALRIDQPKVSFQLDKETREPIGYELQVNRESNQMIEEFMLLANMTVAERLQADYPRLAFLRSHPPPVERMMTVLARTLEKVGIHLDVSSSGGLQQSLVRYVSTDDDAGLARALVLSTLCAKPMARAIYFCSANMNCLDDYWHYALSIPLYTHFTSPIRRYADVMVHRLLAATVAGQPAPAWTSEYVATVASHCNKRKYCAKRAGEQSIELYLVHYIGQRQPLKEHAVVVDVKNNSFDAIVMSNGITVRIYLNNLDPDVKYQIQCDEDEEEQASDESKKLINIILHWPDEPPLTQTIALFAVIDVILTRRGKTLKLDARLARPLPDSPL